MNANATDVFTMARHLFDTQGAQSIADAAHKAASFDQTGDQEQAAFWRRIEAALREMRGPRQT